MGKVGRHPAYLKAGQELKEQCDQEEQRAIDAAKKLFEGAAKDAANTIISLSSSAEEDRVKLDASKHILKLIGLEKERLEVTDNQSHNLDTEFTLEQRRAWLAEELH